MLHPYAPGAAVDKTAVRERLWFADAVLLSGPVVAVVRAGAAPDAVRRLRGAGRL